MTEDQGVTSDASRAPRERSADGEVTPKDTVEIPLSCGRVALVDAEDYHLVAPHRWHSLPGRKTRYAFAKVKLSNGRRTSLYMHRLIMSPPLGMQVDHIDGDGLNNRRRSNLRLCTHAQNLQGRQVAAGSASQFKGVALAYGGKWAAQIETNGRARYLGIFDDEEAAARAYDAAATELFGEFARTNFPRNVA